MTARSPARGSALLAPALLALVALAAPLTGISAAPATAQDTPPTVLSTSGRAP
jgi:uncharacterized protein YggE